MLGVTGFPPPTHWSRGCSRPLKHFNLRPTKLTCAETCNPRFYWFTRANFAKNADVSIIQANVTMRLLLCILCCICFFVDLPVFKWKRSSTPPDVSWTAEKSWSNRVDDISNLKRGPQISEDMLWLSSNSISLTPQWFLVFITGRMGVVLPQEFLLKSLPQTVKVSQRGFFSLKNGVLIISRLGRFFLALFAKILWPLNVTTETQRIKTRAPLLALAPWRTFISSIWTANGTAEGCDNSFFLCHTQTQPQQRSH